MAGRHFIMQQHCSPKKRENVQVPYLDVQTWGFGASCLVHRVKPSNWKTGLRTTVGVLWISLNLFKIK